MFVLTAAWFVSLYFPLSAFLSRLSLCCETEYASTEQYIMRTLDVQRKKFYHCCKNEVLVTCEHVG